MTWKLMDNWFSSSRNRRIIRIQDDGADINIKTATFDETAEDWDNLSDEKLINKVHEWDYRQNMVGKFVNEAVEITEAKAKEITELVDKTKKVFADAESQLAALKERSELAQGSVVEMTEMVFDHEFRISALEGGGLDEEGIESTDETVEDTNTVLEGGE